MDTTGTISALDFGRTVPRWLTHRRSVAEVYVCDSVLRAPDSAQVAVAMPRAHALWSDRPPGHHDPLMAVEAGRQATFAVVHSHYGVPADLVFVMRAVSCRVQDPDAFADDGWTPLEGVFTIDVVDKGYESGELRNMSFEGELVVAGRPALATRGQVVITPREDYDVLRSWSRMHKKPGPDGSAAAPELPPGADVVGRERRRNVVVTEPADRPVRGPGDRLRVVVDESDPAFFDHRLDHVPGPLLLEAGRQTATMLGVRRGGGTASAWRFDDATADFGDFAENDSPTELVVLDVTERAGGLLARLGVEQAGRHLGELEIGVATLDRPHAEVPS